MSRKLECVICNFGEQGWRSGESTRLPPMWPGFDSQTRRHMWVEFVVGSRSCSERFFSGYSGFPLSSKTNISKFQFDPESEGHRFVSRDRLLSVTLVKQSYLFICLWSIMVFINFSGRRALNRQAPLIHLFCLDWL